ncbi:MAG TPA: histidine kinase dimerization/phosphoacceptor domain -containing protein [Alphaproteobacteria bacterium]|jgi:PAS domain S-box-containing protein|nr:histidine kinase dimerization/phosphoacceptor domain -containing protein [Alphaproteobacteria bacterium]
MQTDEFLQSDAFLSSELLKLAVESSGLGVWKVDPAARTVELTVSLKHMLGVPVERNLDYAGFIELIHPDDRVATRAGLAAALAPDGDGNCELEFRVVPPSGETRWLLACGRAFFVERAGMRVPNLFIGTMRDVTVSKQATEHVEMLIHEVNHRVKNSLQLASSLLRLQARRISDPEARHQLEDATARISAIAHIHQRLYRDQDTRRLNFGAFLSELCADLQASMPQCSLTVKAPDLFVSTDRAIPLGLVVNELVSNAFKYAYPDGGGPITVEAALSDGEISIVVADRGVGIPDGFSIDGTGNMGMMLVASLTSQLAGTVEAHRNADAGSTFTVVVAANEKKASADA